MVENKDMSEEKTRISKEWLLFVWGIKKELPEHDFKQIEINQESALIVCNSLKEMRALANKLKFTFPEKGFLSGQCFVKTLAGETALIVNGNRKAIVPTVDIMP